MPEYTYYAVTTKREDNPPWIVLRVVGARIDRWIPHLDSWVRVDGHEDYLVGGLSSTSFNESADIVTEQEADALKPGVTDLPHETVEKLRAKH